MSYEYKSIFKDIINNLIDEKRKLGYKYKTEDRHLKNFDTLAYNLNVCDLNLSKDVVNKYIEIKSWEKPINVTNRVQVIRELAKYLNRMGYKAYVLPPLPKGSYKSDFIPHIFSDDEIKQLFEAIDKWSTSSSLDNQYYKERLKYPLIIRILYSTGMRISEVLSLKVEDIDFKNNTFTILKAKNHSERIIPIHKNTIKMIIEYLDEMNIFKLNDYVFQGKVKEIHLSRKTVDCYFLNFLTMAKISHFKDGPRIHDFRHTFCVHRLKLWVKEGRDINALFPYLCAYMGHADTRCTEYYLRLTADLYPDIVSKSERYLYGENDER